MIDKERTEQPVSSPAQRSGTGRSSARRQPARQPAHPTPAQPPAQPTPAQPSLTRRGFVAGALGLGAVALAAGGTAALGACAPSKEQQFAELVTKGVSDKDIETLQVTSEQVIEATDFERAPFEDYLKLQATYELPLGSIVHQMDSGFALVLLLGGEGESLRKVGMLNLGDGKLTQVLAKPVGTGKNVVIYDARANRNALIWVELDLGNHHWSTYVASLNGLTAQNATLGDARLVEEGDVDYEPPMLAAAEQKLYWTVMPVATGAANKEDSLFRALSLEQEGLYQGEPYTVLTSHGRMITNPLVTNGVVTFVPRVDTANVYYQLTALDCANDRLVDFRVLPQSLRVTDAIYLDGVFSFNIEGNYGYAEGLSNFGIYQELEDGNYLWVGRPPVCPALRFKGCLVIQSTANIVGYDPEQSRYFVIESPPQSPKFGEALVGWGVQDKVVTSTLRLAEDSGAGEATMVRVFG
jgi:hypothetical protein